MFLRVFDSDDETELLNVNSIHKIDYVTTGGNIHVIDMNGYVYMTTIDDLFSVIKDKSSKSYILSILKEMGYNEEFDTNGKEPDSLSEICEVTYEYGRVCLTVFQDEVHASRKFGLLDNYERYEFDGGTLYFYHPGSMSSDFSISCGNGRSTCVDESTGKCIAAVKNEMAKWCVEKQIPIPNSIAYNLSDDCRFKLNNFRILL